MIAIRDLMTPDPMTLAPTDTLRYAAGVLTSIGAGGAPVTRGETVVGVLTMTDILDFAANHPSVPTPRIPRGADVPDRQSAPMAAPEGPEWDVLDEHTVQEVMSLRVLGLPPTADAREAARMMEEEGVHRVLVMEGARLLGILSAWDLVRAVARGDLASRRDD
jgi:CBS domain-containing protein